MLVAFSSVCLNPLIYGLLNPNFRRDLHRLCSKGATNRCSACRQYVQKDSRHTELCGLISSSPLDIYNSVTTKTRDVVSSV